MKENAISHKTIGAAIEVHRILGPGLLESIYGEQLTGQKLLSYLRLSHKKLGFIINFHVSKLKYGVERIVNGLTE